MGNCGLKPKVLSEAGAPAPEELKTSLEDQKIDAAKSLINLFLQDKVDKKMKEDEKMSVTEDLKTYLAESKSPATETKAPSDDQKVGNEEAIPGQNFTS